MSDKSAKRRLSLTLTQVYVEALDSLVEEGLYIDHQAAIRDALRRLFQYNRIEQFTDKGAELETDEN